MTLVIQYERWASNRMKSHSWCAVDEETKEAWDYGSRDYLVQEAIKHGHLYKVIRLHRDGTRSIVLTNISKN